MVAFTDQTGLKRIAAGLLAAAWLLAAPLAAQAQDTKAVDDLMSQAQKAMQKGQPRDAESLLRKAIEAAPTRAELYMLRSRARTLQASTKRRWTTPTNTSSWQPNDAFGYLNRSRIYISMEKPETALADATKAIELDPKEPDGYYRRSDIYRDMGKDAEAKADEAKAAALEKR